MPEYTGLPLYIVRNPDTGELEVDDQIPEIANHNTEPRPPVWHDPAEDPEYERARTAFEGKRIFVW